MLVFKFFKLFLSSCVPPGISLDLVLVATLRRYCVHSTLVPVVVPIFVFPHDWEIHMKELLLSNGRVLSVERGESEVHDWRKFRIQ